MNAEQFEQILRQVLWRVPFEPFVVEFVDGRALLIDHSKVVFGGGAASYFTPNYDLVELVCEEVQAIHPANPGATL